MGIRTTIKQAVGTTEGQVDVTITVDNEGGGGGTFQADVSATYPKTGLTVAGTPKPTPTTNTAGEITWPNHKVDDSGTAFTFSVTCASAGTHKVTGKACPAGSTAGCSEATTDIVCP